MTTTETSAAGTPASRSEPRHGLRIFLIWIILSLAATLVIWFVWYPHMPPGRMSDAATHQQFDIAVLAVTAAPVIIFVILYFVYSLVVWRARPGDDGDGEPIHGSVKVQATWIIGTTIIVLWLFVFGTVELVVPAGAGAGEGPSPIWKLAGAQNDVVDGRLERHAASPGDRPAVGLDVPVSPVWRDGKQRADAAGGHPRHVPRDVA